MYQRIAAGVLWFFAGLYLGGYVALLAGISDMIGPVLGISAAVLFAGDPLGIIWSRHEVAADIARRSAGSAEELAEGA